MVVVLSSEKVDVRVGTITEEKSSRITRRLGEALGVRRVGDHRVAPTASTPLRIPESRKDSAGYRTSGKPRKVLVPPRSSKPVVPQS
jgi:hypothetical protein